MTRPVVETELVGSRDQRIATRRRLQTSENSLQFQQPLMELPQTPLLERIGLRMTELVDALKATIDPVSTKTSTAMLRFQLRQSLSHLTIDFQQRPNARDSIADSETLSNAAVHQRIPISNIANNSESNSAAPTISIPHRRYLSSFTPRKSLKALIDSKDTDQLLTQFGSLPVEQRSKDDWVAVFLYLCAAKRPVDVLHLLNQYFQYALLLPPLIAQPSASNSVTSSAVRYPLKALSFPPKMAADRRRRKMLPNIVLREIMVLLASPSAVADLELHFGGAEQDATDEEGNMWPASIRNAALRSNKSNSGSTATVYYMPTTPELTERRKNNPQAGLPDQLHAFTFVAHIVEYVRTHSYAFPGCLDIRLYNRVLSSASIATNAFLTLSESQHQRLSGSRIVSEDLQQFIRTNGLVSLAFQWIYEAGLEPNAGSWTILIKAQRDLAMGKLSEATERTAIANPTAGNLTLDYLRSTESDAKNDPALEGAHQASVLARLPHEERKRIIHDTLALLDQSLQSNIVSESTFSLTISTLAQIRAFDMIPAIMERYWMCGTFAYLGASIGTALIRAYLSQAVFERAHYNHAIGSTSKNEPIALQVTALQLAVMTAFQVLEGRGNLSQSVKAAILDAYSEIVGGDPIMIQRLAQVLFPNLVSNLDVTTTEQDTQSDTMGALDNFLVTLSEETQSMVEARRRVLSVDSHTVLAHGWFLPSPPEIPSSLRELSNSQADNDLRDTLSDQDLLAQSRAVSVLMRAYASILTTVSAHLPGNESGSARKPARSLPSYLLAPLTPRECLESVCAHWLSNQPLPHSSEVLPAIPANMVWQHVMTRLQRAYGRIKELDLPLTKTVIIALVKAFASGPAPEGVDSALSLLTSLKEQGMEPDRQVGNVVLGQVASGTDSDLLVKVITKLRELGYPFDPIAFNSVLSHFSNLGNRKAVYAWFGEMDQSFGEHTIPNVPSASALANAHPTIETIVRGGIARVAPNAMSLLYLLRTIAKAQGCITSQDMSVTLYAIERLYSITHKSLRSSYPDLFNVAKNGPPVYISLDTMLTVRHHGDALLLAESIALRASPLFLLSHLQLVQSFLRSPDDPNAPTFISFAFANQALIQLDKVLTALCEPSAREAAIRAGALSEKDCQRVDSLHTRPFPGAALEQDSEVRELRQRTRQLYKLLRSCRLIEDPAYGWIAYSRPSSTESNAIRDYEGSSMYSHRVSVSAASFASAPTVGNATIVPANLYRTWLQQQRKPLSLIYPPADSPPRLYLPLRLAEQLETIARDANYLVPLAHLEPSNFRFIRGMDLTATS